MNWDEIYNRIVESEGFKTKIYLDPIATTKDYPNGIPTIGPGIALYPGIEFPVNAISEIACRKFRECIENYHRFEKEYGFELDSVRRSVIVEMIWNIGFAGVCRFKRMITGLLLLDYDVAADEILDSAVHRKLIGLRGTRRFKVRTEVWAKMMRQGET